MVQFVPMSGGGGVVQLPRDNSDLINLQLLQQALGSVGDIGTQIKAQADQQALADALGGTPATPGAIGAGTGFAGSPELGGGANVGAPATPALLPPNLLPIAQQLARSGNFDAAIKMVSDYQAQQAPPTPYQQAQLDIAQRGVDVDLMKAMQPDMSTSQKEAAALGFDLGTPEGANAYAQWQQSLSRPPAAPTVNLPPQEREGQVLAARFVDKLETEQLPAVRRQLTQVDQIEALFDEGLETGRLAELKASLGNFFGVEIDPNASGLEAARSLINGVIVNKIGEATFGALSEGERSFLAGITADTAITPEANRRRLAIAKKMLRYEQSIQREASRYADEQGTTAGLGAHLDQWAASNPLVTEADLRKAPAPDAGGIADGTIATNPQTGQSLIRRGGRWVPI